VSQWGHDFRPEYLPAHVLHERFPRVPRVALTATADAPTRREIVERLAAGTARACSSAFDRPNIRYTVVSQGRQRSSCCASSRRAIAAMRHRLLPVAAQGRRPPAGCSRRASTPCPTTRAGRRSVRAPPAARFLREDGIVMVATIAFGMGIDKPDVRFVAHIDLPKSDRGLLPGNRPRRPRRRAGRGLDDLRPGRRRAAAPDDRGPKPATSASASSSAKLDALLGYCESTAGCRRQATAGLFRRGSRRLRQLRQLPEPPQTWDATEAARKALSCVYRTGSASAPGT
jgi:ATP-dependent DNA helicase RecQ